MTTDTPTPRVDAESGEACFTESGCAAEVVNADFARTLERDLATCRAALREQSVVDVLAERQRQIEREGWTPEHDDAHDAGDMAAAATCYALNAACMLSPYDGTEYDPFIGGGPEWPWATRWWKPTTPRRDLVKAAALILAEIDRLDRAAARALVGQEGDGHG